MIRLQSEIFRRLLTSKWLPQCHPPHPPGCLSRSPTAPPENTNDEVLSVPGQHSQGAPRSTTNHSAEREGLEQDFPEKKSAKPMIGLKIVWFMWFMTLNIVKVC